MVLTEPEAGSDVGAGQTRATLDGADYVLNGSKRYITNAGKAGLFTVMARTNPDVKGGGGVSAFVVPSNLPGITVGKPEKKMGQQGAQIHDITFDNVRVPAWNRLGAEGEGFKIAMTVLDAGRIGIASQALGIAEACLEASISYARERVAFGQPIGQFQMIQQKLADMKCRVEASRLLIYQAALAKMAATQSGQRYTLEASMAKLFASDTANYCATEAVQIHGGMGYSKEMPLERYFRDAKITEIYEGTSEIQLMIISRNETGCR